MSDPVIIARQLTRIYRLGGGEVRAVDGVSLQIDQGEFVAIMGASGSGKTTLMNIFGCLDAPTTGTYLLDGIDVGQLSEPLLAAIRSERLGFVFQTFNLLARTSALENVALPLSYAATAPRARSARLARARDSLRLMALAERESSSPGQLSGGQQQRVAIARALINRPSLLLADEPTGNLDTRTSHDIMQLLQSLNHEQGVTVVVVTHEPDVAAFTDRVITMRDGKVISDSRNRASDHEALPAARTVSPMPAPPARVAGVHAWSFASMVVSTAAQSLRRNLMRSLLTMLGVFIGVAALIAMVAVGQGADAAVRRQIESLGTNLLVVVPGATTASGVRAGFGSASTLTVSDAQAIAREDTAVARVSVSIRGLGQAQYAGQNWTTSIQAVTRDYMSIANWRIASGRAWSAEEDSNGALVVLLGQSVYRQLFAPSDNPVGATLLVKGVPLRVIGLLGAKGQSAFGQDQDDLLLIPFVTGERRVLGVAAPSQAETNPNNYFPVLTNPYGTPPRLTGYVNQIYVQAASPALVPLALTQTTATLTRRHRIQSGDTADFSVRNLSQIADTATSSSRIMALLLAVVASISLLVGGIGIMNILLVSVTERTREIGLRMAIGAGRAQVLLQFLTEAVLLSLTGGALGMAAGVAASELVSVLAGWPTLLSPAAIGGGLVFSVLVGVFFGYYPARKAARLNPIDALRYE
jgi:macrolide transport system ATP-binding/permease protein